MSDLDLKRLLAIEEIRNLRILYSQYLDMHDLENLMRLFTQDVICDFGAGEWHGLEEVKGAFVAAHEQYDKRAQGTYPFLHATTNHWVEVISEDLAEGRCYLLDFVTGDAREEPLYLLGLYADQYKRIDGKWKIHRSRIDFAWPNFAVGGGAPGNGLIVPGAVRSVAT